MMYWLGLVLFAYLLVALFILGMIVFRQHRLTGSYKPSMVEMVALTMYCAVMWPIAMYRGKLKINFKS